MRIGKYELSFKGIKKEELVVDTDNHQDLPQTSNNKNIPPGRVSVPNDSGSLLKSLATQYNFVDTDFNREFIPLIRKIYKVNPDMSIALQDTFKLANTGHNYEFPYNTDVEAKKMEEHLSKVSKQWSNYTAGIDGLVNKMIVQCLIGGAVSIEAVPNNNLNGLATILFIKPEEIYFKRENNGVYHPYQINKSYLNNQVKSDYVKLNLSTFKYISTFSDVDEPNGVPPFMAALDALLTQSNMKVNFKEIMALVGMLGFLEVKVAKPTKKPTESEPSYQARLDRFLLETKTSVKSGMSDGVVVGYEEDHEFKMNSTAKDAGNVDKLWALNQQSVANGLSTTGPLIGVNATTSEGGTGILLSKLISQLKNIQVLVNHVLSFIYELELRLAGFNCKGVVVSFRSTTISDEVKLQQGLEYKIRNLQSLYKQGIISQTMFAREMGYRTAHLEEPIPEPIEVDGTDPKAKEVRKDDKNRSARGERDKKKVVPKRADQDSRPRGN